MFPRPNCRDNGQVDRAAVDIHRQWIGPTTALRFKRLIYINDWLSVARYRCEGPRSQSDTRDTELYCMCFYNLGFGRKAHLRRSCAGRANPMIPEP